jgi:hypothetical protein
MKKTVVLGLIGLVMILAVSAGADFRYYNAERNVTVSVVADDQGLINLKPVQPYAYISDNGNLIIDFSNSNKNWQSGLGLGISPDSRYVFDCVFAISNDLWENETIVVDLAVSAEGQDVFRLYSPASHDNQDSSTATENLTVTIHPEEEVCIGMVVNTSDVAMGEYTAKITIHSYLQS